MISYDQRNELDDIVFDLKWIAEYIHDVEIMREKVLGLAECLAEIIEKVDCE